MEKVFAPFWMDPSNMSYSSQAGKYERWKPMWLMMTDTQKKVWVNTQEFWEIGGENDLINFLAKLDKEIKEFRDKKDKDMAKWINENQESYKRNVHWHATSGKGVIHNPQGSPGYLTQTTGNDQPTLNNVEKLSMFNGGKHHKRKSKKYIFRRKNKTLKRY